MGFFDRFKKKSTVEVEEKSEVLVDPVAESQAKLDEAIRALDRENAAKVKEIERESVLELGSIEARLTQLNHAPGAIHMRSALADEAKEILGKLNTRETNNSVKKPNPDTSQKSQNNQNDNQSTRAQALDDSLAKFARQMEYNYKNNLGTNFDNEIYGLCLDSSDSRYYSKYSDKIDLWSKEGVGGIENLFLPYLMEKQSLGIIASGEQLVLNHIISNKEPEDIDSILTKSFCCLHKSGMVNLNNSNVFENLTKDLYYASLLDNARQEINLNINNNNINDYSQSNGQPKR